MSYQNLHMRELGDEQKWFNENVWQFIAGCLIILGFIGLAVYGLFSLLR